MLTKPVSIHNPPKDSEISEFLNTLIQNTELTVDLYATYDILMQDMGRLLASAKECSDSQDMDGLLFHSRSLIRSIFPYVEFATYWFFQMCLIFEETVNRITLKDRTKLEAFIENQKAGRMQTLDAFKFSVRCLVTAYELSNPPNFMCSEWHQFIDSTSIRDRLMHPKRKKDLMIEIDEYAMMGSGISWIMDTINGLVEVVTVKVRILFGNTDAPIVDASVDISKFQNRLQEVQILMQLIREGKVELSVAQAWIRDTNISSQ
jgi:hypothetical protein